ncbi:AMP-binding protein [Kribbella italica]|uniref:Acyl-CoA synthetase (AMP-forming)/AMP-acid ligase II n=1 Tax=Kribbella italica TaxID=1540520 RepID=A0A7W9MUE0_9ACTN|nr:AMP-binding protein [Kribbella italica]MBB5836746.1 acyl-CoA synthetase (AMP-forming)/AMP-acid ligase II [Kribbella italica]
MVTLKGLLRLLRAVPFWRPRVLRTLFSEGLTLSALISIAALKNPDGTALIDDDGPLTYADLNHLIDEATADLQTTRVDVQEPNHRSFVVAVAAALRQSADVVLHEPSKSPPPQSSQHSTPSRRRGQIILLTSGSTGTPKEVERGGVRITQALPIATLLGALPIHGPIVLTVPMFHGFGLGFLALGLAFGVPVVLWRKLNPPTVAEFITDNPGCLLVGVPPVLARVARVQTRAHPAAVVSGAGQLHPSVADRLRTTYGDVVFNLYGSSEEGWSTIADPADLRAAPGTIGRPAAGVKVAVLDADGRPVDDGEIGHLCISGRLEFQQYGGGGRRARLGGMSDSGDLGHRDPQGRFFVDGRADDMVVTGGENVFPAEVENVLLQHPAVAEARVDGVPDEEYGARLEATVVRRTPSHPDDVLTEAELIAWARTRLTGAKVPRTLRFAAVLPTTASGKYRRRVT